MEHVYTQTFGVAGALIEKEGKFLLVRETKKIARGLWNQPAGWIDLGENPIEAVKREVKEETGYDFKPTHFLGVYSLYKKHLEKKFGITPHVIKLIFLGDISEERGDLIEDEISETKWFSPEEIYQMGQDALRDINIKEMLKDYLAGRRYPLDIVKHTISK